MNKVLYLKVVKDKILSYDFVNFRKTNVMKIIEFYR